MASQAASETIFFIGAIVVSTALVGVFGAVVHDFSGGLSERGDVLAKELRTSIAIINDPNEMQTDPLVIYVKNTGRTNVHVNLTTVLYDGQVQTDLAFDVLASTDDSAVRVGDVLQITVNGLTVTSGDHRVRVVTDAGIEAELEFHKA